MIIHYDNYSYVETVQERLAAFVRERMSARGLTSTYKVAARSGGLVSNTTVWNVLNGTYKDIGVLTLKGLARALEVDEDTIFNVVKDKPFEKAEMQRTPFYLMSVKFERLNESDKKAMEEILDMVNREIDWRNRHKGIQAADKSTAKNIFPEIASNLPMSHGDEKHHGKLSRNAKRDLEDADRMNKEAVARKKAQGGADRSK